MEGTAAPRFRLEHARAASVQPGSGRRSAIGGQLPPQLSARLKPTPAADITTRTVSLLSTAADVTEAPAAVGVAVAAHAVTLVVNVMVYVVPPATVALPLVKWPCVRSPVCESVGAREAARMSGVGSLYSSRLSHVPQSGHLPIHLGCTLPQELQRNRVFALATRADYI